MVLVGESHQPRDNTPRCWSLSWTQNCPKAALEHLPKELECHWGFLQRADTPRGCRWSLRRSLAGSGAGSNQVFLPSHRPSSDLTPVNE